MKNEFIIQLFSFCLCTALQAQVSVAVGNFENRSDWMYLDTWAQKTPDYLQHELSRNPDIVLVERDQLNTILNEQALSMAGLVDSSNVREVGRLISAEYIITGVVDKNGDWLRIDAKVINTNTGKVVTEKVQTKDKTRLNEMVALLGNNLGFQLSGRGAYQSSVKIQQYPTTYFLGATLISGLATELIQKAYTQKRHDYQAAMQLKDFNPAYDSANRLYHTRNVLIGVTGVAFIGTLYCWLHNMSPEQILASQPMCLPYAYHQTGETIVGVQIAF